MICSPEGVAVDSSSNVFFGDYLNLRVREISSSGTITTVAGSGDAGYNGENLPAASTHIDGPIAVGVSNGTIFYADDGQNRVRKLHWATR